MKRDRMKDFKAIDQLAKELHEDRSQLPYIEVRKGALQAITPYIREQGFRHITIIVDDNTWEAAGERIFHELEKHQIGGEVVLIKSNEHDQVLADEDAIVQVLVETSQQSNALIAVGTGTIHDITRFCSHKMNIPFLSVPTAASVDGYTSKGAPLILRGFKQTIQTASPIAVFADIDIIKKAPREMTAAGFGDILAKNTSLLDWKISHWINDEPYNGRAADLTRNSLQLCIDHVEEIAQADDEGIRLLMNALIESGLVMLLLNFSRSASGGEHHLSHYWEMDLLKRNAPQVLHGAKVGVATAIITELYQSYANDLDVFGANTGQIAEEIHHLYKPDQMTQWLQLVGGATTPYELGIDDDLVQKSLNEAFRLRDRYTGLYLINQAKSKEILYPVSKNIEL